MKLSKTIKVVGQLTIRKNIVSLISEEESFPYHKGDIVRLISRKTFDKLPKKPGEPLTLVL